MSAKSKPKKIQVSADCHRMVKELSGLYSQPGQKVSMAKVIQRLATDALFVERRKPESRLKDMAQKKWQELGEPAQRPWRV